jgi:hypothetical protein
MTLEMTQREKETITRRTFFTKGAGCAAGLSLLAFPGMIREVLASKGDKPKEVILKELEDTVEKFMLNQKKLS